MQASALVTHHLVILSFCPHRKRLLKTISLAIAVLLSGCATAPTYQRLPSQVIYEPPFPQQVVTIYSDPPLYQPAPVRVQWAPPPMRIEMIPYQPYPEAIWTGGYWVWQGNWVWAHGRWAAPPQPGYAWVHPYYENRGGSVVFINGFWAAPGVNFIAPAPNVFISTAVIGNGVIAGQRPIGPEGIFVPPPPGSRSGLIVPAPLGTPPAVVINAPAITNQGMRVRNGNITYNNSTNLTNVTNVRNVSNINTINNVVPATGQAVTTSTPVQPPPIRMPPPAANYVRPVTPDNAQSRTSVTPVAATAPHAGNHPLNNAGTPAQPRPAPEHEKRERRRNEESRQNDRS
jgi:hypothetical protein